MKDGPVATLIMAVVVSAIEVFLLWVAASLLDIPGVTLARLCGGGIVLSLAASTVRKAA